MEKKQYDEIIALLGNAERDDLVTALSTTVGFELCQQVEQLQDERNEMAKQLLAERQQAEVVRNDLAATYKTITQLRGQLADAQQRIKDYEDERKSVMDERCGDDRQHCTCVPDLRDAVKEAREEMFDLFHQACCMRYVDKVGQYDNQCMSIYEYAEEKLIEWGLLKPEQCLRRKK